MRQLLKEEDGTSVNVFYHYKLIMRPEKHVDDMGMVRPDVFCNGYALVAELEACKHNATDENNFFVKNISIANHKHGFHSGKKAYLEDNNNLVYGPSSSPSPSPTPSSTSKTLSEPPSEPEKSVSQDRYSNTHLSVADALLIMRNNTKHLGVLFASTSFVRLRLQSRPIDLPGEKKFTGSHGLAAATERALQQVERLHDEIKFLHQYALKCEESDRIIPGDVLVEQKQHRTSKMPTILIVSVLVVVVVNNCFFKFPSLTFEL